jgi:hypothetical protein
LWWRKERIQSNQTIECIPLTDLLFEHVPSQPYNNQRLYFDIFSLDVEGAEISVLSTLDFSKVAYGAVVIEASDCDEVRNIAIQSILTSNGYQYLYEQKRSLWFVHKHFYEIYKNILY